MTLQIECGSQESAYKLKIVNEAKENIKNSHNKLTIEADKMKITIKKLKRETQEVKSAIVVTGPLIVTMVLDSYFTSSFLKISTYQNFFDISRHIRRRSNR